MNIDQERVVQIQLTDGTAARTAGQCRVGAIIADIWKNIDWLCLPGLTVPMVLGIDAMKAWRLKFDLE